MPSIPTFLASPLARHPSLLIRKARQRLGLYHETGPLPAPPVAEAIFPDAWRKPLEEWIRRVPITKETHPFDRVFGQEFSEPELLRMCGDGPNFGHKDLTGDIKLIWDYSRAHALFLNSIHGASRLDDNVAFLRRWLTANANTDGHAWTCAMDVALRAVNWVFADGLNGGALARRLGARDWAQWLWRHGFVIWRRLESRMIPSNHYLANLLGLQVIGSLFPKDSSARTWRQFAIDEFPRALLAQTRTDGGLNEASLRYHAFVTEMALVFRLASTTPWPAGAEARLASMCEIIANLRDASGDVFPFGDDDSGRVLALDHATSTGRTDVLLGLAEVLLGRKFRPATSSVYPASGWAVQRQGDWVMAAEFGGVGLRGLGGHAHNDDLSFCLEWKGRSVVVDPGTYAYTWNFEARNRFRSVLSHNTLILDGEEPLPLTANAFFLPGPDSPLKVLRQPNGSWTLFRQLKNEVRHQRTMHTGGDGNVAIEDAVDGTRCHRMEWRFHIHPDWNVTVHDSQFILTAKDRSALCLEVNCPTATLRTISGEFSPGYGHVQSCTVAIVTAENSLPVQARFVFRQALN